MGFDALSHDVGFQFLLSAGAAYKLTGNMEMERHTRHAASLLQGRYNPNGFLRAWNPQGREGWAIVDCMMNLPLLYWASKQTEDPRFAQVAKIHADTTMKHFVRSDGSCNHIVIFDPDTGEALETPGGQGYAPGSSWSRGQAWALYGFVLSYLWTREARYMKPRKTRASSTRRESMCTKRTHSWTYMAFRHRIIGARKIGLVGTPWMNRDLAWRRMPRSMRLKRIHRYGRWASDTWTIICDISNGLTAFGNARIIGRTTILIHASI